MKVAIVGSTGLVGSEMIKVLEESNMVIDNLVLFASKRSAGKKIKFRDKNYEVKNIDHWEKEDFKYALFSAGGSVSLKYIPEMNKKDITVIDNSSAYRMNKNVPLVIPSVNMKDVKDSLLIANPNCSTIQMVMVLNELEKLSKIKRVIVSTYQSVSGAGYEGINELKNNTKKMLEDKNEYSFDKFYHNIAFNNIPQIDVFLDNDYTKEEFKMIEETSKIMNRNIPLTATCVRTPTFFGHAESLNVEFEDIVSPNSIFSLLENNSEIKVIDNPKEKQYPLNHESRNLNKVLVGRVRSDNSLETAINLWIVADNLRIGAAYNAVSILENLTKFKK